MNDIEKLVLDIIGEDVDSPDVFNTTGISQIRTSINDAIQEVSMITGCVVKEFYMPLKADSIFYRLVWDAATFGWVTDAYLYNQKRRLKQTDLFSLNQTGDWMEDTGSPVEYMQIGLDILGFHPVNTSDTDMVQFTCVVIPNVYSTDADKINLMDNHKWATVHYAVSEFWASRGDAKTAMYHFNEYLKRIGYLETFPFEGGFVRKYQYQTNKESSNGLVQ